MSACRDRRHKLPGQLSGGQQQRVAIARAIVIEPPLVLMDEPLSNLDAKLRLEMRAEIRRIHNELGATTIYVTHDQDEALSLADRIVVLRDGVIRQVGTPKELYEAPAHFDVADFMGFRNKLKGQGRRQRGRPRRPRRGGRADQRHRPGARRRSGSTAFAAIRPDDLVVGEAGSNAIAASVETIEYRGREFVGTAHSPGGLDFVFRSHHSRRARLRRFICGRRTSACSSSRSRSRGGSDGRCRAGPGHRARTQPSPAPGGPGLRRRHPAGRSRQRFSCLLLFIYPFAFGFVLSFEPKAGGDWLANYRRFFSDPFLYETIANTLWLAVPVTLINLLLAVPIAFRVRLMRRQRLLTTILVLPITLGTVLVAEGLLNYLGPQGWFNRTLLTFGLISQPLKLVHNYWGVFSSLVITGFPFTFLLTLSYVTGIDPALEQAAATLGASAWQRFRHVYLPLLMPGFAITFCLSFVQAFSVFPSAVLLGEPAGVTRVISIAAAIRRHSRNTTTRWPRRSR